MSKTVSRAASRLVLCSMGALFWELALIRWQGACLRIVAYYSNFILIAAFFGLGVGALLAKRSELRLERFLFVALMASVLLGVGLSGVANLNPIGADEFVWLGGPRGIGAFSESVEQAIAFLPFWAVLAIVYVVDAAIFAMFGSWMGRLFKEFEPVPGYSLEIAGSILGVLSFAAVVALGGGPVSWFVVGFVLILLAFETSRGANLLALVCIALTLGVSAPFARQYTWSPYYKIDVNPLTEVEDEANGVKVRFGRPIGYTLDVNNDYHQMILDLATRVGEPDFQRSWRQLYDLPYREAASLPPGPVLVVGAGTGNDVSAALRGTDRQVDAVEIDPAILGIGRRLHFERPYQDPRVHVVVDDARSHFQRTDRRYALVVFGFLDSHTLLSSFSSLRLDNFVYTLESLRSVRELLLPGGEVYLTFASNNEWIHGRIGRLLDQTFDEKTRVSLKAPGSFANGIVYRNARAAEPSVRRRTATDPGRDLPTDDWPFLYLKERTIPSHYRVFIGIVLALGAGAMLLLPKGKRQIRFPYFFMGAAFFLIETSNVVRLSLLYGSTWIVNVVVFTGILLLVLLGNLASLRLRGEAALAPLFSLLLASVVAAYAVSPARLLGIANPLLQGAVAVLVYLGPVLFASVIFALLIRDETDFYQAYGSNVLGAVVGGACEYLSLLTGFRFLLIVTIGFYVVVFLMLRPGRGGRVGAMSGA